MGQPLGLSDLAAAIARGETTSLDATRAALDRIDRSQPSLNAFRIVRRESALSEAVAADERLARGERLPLLGVPIAVKDDTDVSGEPTAFGCGGTFPRVERDSEVVRRLRAAGAVIVGKTNTCEIGQWPFTDSQAFGYTRNPWDRKTTPGGSSGGAAAAVAAGLVPVALGSDGAGSIRIPAAWTNLVGIKPQRGRISTWPHAESFNGLTVNGPLARTVADAALLLDVAAGNHESDRFKPPPISAREAVGRDPGRLRIAMAFNAPFTAFPSTLDAEVRAGTEHVAAALRRFGHDVIVSKMPYSPLFGASFLPRSLAGIHGRLNTMPKDVVVDPRTRANAFAGSLLRGPTLSAARRAETALHRQAGKIFRDFDVVLSPTTAKPPPRVDAMDGLSGVATDRLIISACPYAWPWNVLGWPSVAVPAGFTRRGLPVGSQLMGPANSEPLLISVAAQLESELSWHKASPASWWA